MNCPSCHVQVPDGATFCDQCGASIGSAMPAGAPMPPQQFGPAPVGGGTTCPSCGAAFVPGTAFCDNCGASLSGPGVPQPPQQVPQFPPQQVPQFPPQQVPQFPPQQVPQFGQQPPMPARLMIGGQSITVPQKAEVMIGRADVASSSFPDVDLTPYGASPQTGVSRQHAKLTWQGAWMVEDMNSTNGTTVRGQKLVPHQKTQINTGDPLIIGTLQLTFYAS